MHRECIRLWHANRARHLSFNVLVSKGHEWSNFRLHIFLFSSFFSFVWTNESRKGRGKVSIDAKYMYIDRIGGRESRVEKNLLQTQIHFVLRIIQLQTLKKLWNVAPSIPPYNFYRNYRQFPKWRIDQWPASEAPFRPVHLYYANCAGTATRSKFQSKGFRGDPSPHCTGSCAPWGLLAPCNFTLASVHARFAYSGVYWNTSGDRA